MSSYTDLVNAAQMSLVGSIMNSQSYIDQAEEERKRKQRELEAASQLTEREASRRKSAQRLESMIGKTPQEKMLRAASAALWNENGKPKEEPKPGAIQRIAGGYKLGTGMDEYYEGYGIKRTNGGVGGEDKIAAGRAIIEANKNAANWGHQWADMSDMSTWEKAKEYGKALADPVGLATDIAMSLPASLDIAKYQMGAGVAGNLAALTGAGAVAGAGIHGVGITTATHMEASDEANAVYEQIFNEQREAGKSEQEAHRIAKGMADETYYKNLAILGASNAIEQLTMFGGYASAAVKAAKAAGKTAENAGRIARLGEKVDDIKDATGITRVQDKLADMGKVGKAIEFAGRTGITAGAEGAQEGLQYIASQTSMDKDWDFGTEFAQNVTAGMAMGGGMGVAGQALNIASRAGSDRLRSKLASRAAAENPSPTFPSASQYGSQVHEQAQQAFVAGLPEEVKTQVKNDIETLVDAGLEPGVATSRALDNLMATSEEYRVIADEIVAKTVENQVRTALAQPETRSLILSALPQETQEQLVDIAQGLETGTLDTPEKVGQAIDFMMEDPVVVQTAQAFLQNRTANVTASQEAQAAAPEAPQSPGAARYTAPPEEPVVEPQAAPEAPAAPEVQVAPEAPAAPESPALEDGPVVSDANIDTNEAPVSPVQDRQAAIDASPDLASRGVKLVKVKTPSEKRIRALAAQLGLEVEFFTTNAEGKGTAEFVMPGDSGVIYIRKGGIKRGGRTEAWALGHGFVHALKQQYPELYEQLAQVVADTITVEQIARYLSEFSPERQAAILNTPGLLLEEIIADEGGNFFLQPEVWQNIKAADNTLFEKLIAFMREFLASVQGTAKRVENHLNDKQIQRFAEAFEKVVAQVAQQDAATVARVAEQRDVVAFSDRKEDKKGLLSTSTRANMAQEGVSAKELYDTTKERNGFTYDALQDVLVTKGISVSPYPEYERVVPEAEFSPEAIEDYLIENLEMFALPDHRFGMWYNEENGNYYFDVSIVVNTREEGVKIGIEHNQLAAYDLGEGEEIHVQTAEERAERESQQKADSDGRSNQRQSQAAGQGALSNGHGRQSNVRLDSGERQGIWDVQGSPGREDKRRGPEDDQSVSQGRDDGRVNQRGAKGLVVRLSPEITEILKRKKVDITDIKNVGDPGVFYMALKNARKVMERAAYVDLHTIQEYKDMQLFLTADKRSGVAVEKNGNIVSLFNASKNPRINRGSVQLILRALSAGGNKLDNFDGFLTRAYEQLGFVPIARTPFSKQVADEYITDPPWDYARDGTPDIVFFAHNGDSPAEVARKYGTYEVHDLSKVPSEKDYDVAQKMRDDYLAKGAPKFSDRKAKHSPKELLVELEKLNNISLELATDLANTPRHKAANIVHKIFTGQDVTFFRVLDYKDWERFDGVMLMGGLGTFINVDTTNPVMHTAKHEMIHELEETHPKHYQKLMEVTLKYLQQNPEKHKAAVDAYLGKGPYGVQDIWKEWTSDGVSEVMEEPGFWEMVRKDSPELVRKIVDILDMIIARFREAITEDTSMLKYIDDIEGYKREVAGVTAEVLSDTDIKFSDRDPQIKPGESEAAIKFSLRDGPPPAKTRTAFKLMKRNKDGTVSPLYLSKEKFSADDKTWYTADEQTWYYGRNGKKYVLSNVGHFQDVLIDGKWTREKVFAYHPGIHASVYPDTQHHAKNDGRVWAEIEIPDVDHTKTARSVALGRRNGVTKAGILRKSEAYLDYMVPEGFYWVNSSAEPTGDWIIASDMKIKRLLTYDEAAAITAKLKKKNQGKPSRVKLNLTKQEMRLRASMTFEEPRFSDRQVAPAFFSQLQKTIAEKMPNRAQPGQVLNIISKGAVKQEEIDWSGIKEWLIAKKGAVTKEEVLEYLAANDVQITEVYKGTNALPPRPKPGPEIAEYRRDYYALAQDVADMLNANSTGMGSFTSTYVITEPPEAILDELSYHIAKGRGITQEEAEKNPLYLQGEDLVNEFMAAGDKLRKARDAFNEIEEKYDEDLEAMLPKYASYKLGGGEGYTELLLRLPTNLEKTKPLDKDTYILEAWGPDLDEETYRAAEEDYRQYFNDFEDYVAKYAGNDINSYRSSHWDEPNVLAHVRYDTRTGPNGEKVLFIQEIQSDWHQDGRKRGYQDKKGIEVKKDINGFYRAYIDGEQIVGEGRMVAWATQEDAQRAAQDRLNRFGQSVRKGVPDAPFKKSWQELVLKRMIRYAAENGYDRLALPRVDQVPEIEAWPNSYEEIKADPNLERRFGAILDRYEKDIPRFLNKYVKKWGAKVEKTSIVTGNPVYKIVEPDGHMVDTFHIRDVAERYLRKWNNEPNYPLSIVEEEPRSEQPSIRITDAMKDSVLQEGQPLFSDRKVAPTFFSQLQKTITEKMPPKMQPGSLVNLLAKFGVKQEEIDWTGIKEWLTAQKGQVTKEQVLDFLQLSDLGVKEQVKSKSKAGWTDKDEAFLDEVYTEAYGYQEELLDLYASALDVEYPMRTFEEEDYAEDYFDRWEMHMESIVDDAAYEHALTLREIARRKMEAFVSVRRKLKDLNQRRKRTRKVAPKYERYALEGGEDYTELLLTLPTALEKEKPLDKDTYILQAWGPDLDEETYRAAEENYRQYVNDFADDVAKYAGSDISSYRSSHWDEPNVLAHIRFNTRKGVNGENVLFIEEIQSDWHQAGKERGYKDKEYQREHQALKEREQAARDKAARAPQKYGLPPLYHPLDAEKRLDIPKNEIQEWQRDYDEWSMARRELNAFEEKKLVPDAPLKDTWQQFALKRMIRWAAENGYDRIAWTTGDQQYERWGSEKVDWMRNPDGGWLVSASEQHGGNVNGMNIEDMARERGELIESLGKPVKNIEDLRDVLLTIYRGESAQDKAAKLADRVWKRMAKEDEGSYLPRREGMLSFYDEKLGGFLNKYVKKWGAKVEETIIGGDLRDTSAYRNGGPAEVERIVREKKPKGFTLQPSIPITQAMKDSVLQEGQPLFSDRKNPDMGKGWLRRGNITTVLEGAYEATHKALVELSTAPGGPGTYKRQSIKSWEEEAQRRVAADREKAIIDATDPKMMVKDVPVRLAMALQLIHIFSAEAKAAEASGDFEAAQRLWGKAADINFSAATIFTQLGQGAASGLLWANQDGASLLNNAHRKAQKVYDKLPEKARKKFEGVTQQGQQEMDRINGEAIDGVLDSQGVSDAIEQAVNQVEEAAKGREKAQAEKKKKIKRTPPEILAAMIRRHVSDPKVQEEDPIKQMLATLMDVARQVIPKEKIERDNPGPIEIIREALRDREHYREVWDQSKDIFRDKYGADFDQIEDFFAHYLSQPFSDKLVTKGVKEGMKSLDVKIKDIIRQHYSVENVLGQTLVTKFIQNLDLEPNLAAAIEAKVRDELNKQTRDAKTKVLENLVKKQVRRQDRKYFVQKMVEFSNLGAFGVETYRNALAKEMGIPVIDEEAGAEIMRLADIIQTADGPERDEAMAQLNAFMASLNPPKFLRKVSSFQTMMMLLNPKTNIRNIVGNEAMFWADRVSKLVATPIDMARSKLTKTERTVTFRTGTGVEFGFWAGFAKGWSYGWRGWIVNDITSQYDLQYGLSFPKKEDPAKNFVDGMQKWMNNIFLSGGERLLRATLQGFDYAAYNRAYNTTIGELACVACINNKEPLTKENIQRYAEALDLTAIQIAQDYGKYLTFQDDNAITKVLVKGKNALNMGLGWGVGDWLLKFPRTAGGLLMRGLEYSPLGFIRSVKYAYLAFAEPNLRNQRELSLSLSRLLVGSLGLTLFGMKMAALGLIFGAGEDDKDFEAFARSQGMRTTGFNATGIRRWIFSGFDAEQAKPQKGDLFITYDWAQPLAASIAMGVGMSRAAEISKTDVAQGVLVGLAGAVNSVVEQPLLRGIQNLVAPSYGGDGTQHILRAMGSVFSGIPASFMPSMLNLVRQDVDNVKRYTKGTDGFNVKEETLNLIKNKIPWVSKGLPASINGFGQEELLQGTKPTGLMKLFHVYLNPAYVNRYNPSPEAKQALDIYAATGSVKHLPNTVPYKITVNGEKISLSAKDRMELQKRLGNLVTVGYLAMPDTWSKDKQAAEMVKYMGEAWTLVRDMYLIENRPQELVDTIIKKETQKAKEAR